MTEADIQRAVPCSMAQAKVTGDRYYYTGRPCKRGHVCARIAATGNCLQCRRLEASNRYRKDLQKSRAARRAAAARQREKNPERFEEACARHEQRNPGAQKRRSRECYDRLSPEKRREKIEASKIWRKENPDRWRQISKAWSVANPEKRAEYDRRTRAARRQAEGRHTADDVARIFAAQKGKCAYCKARLRKGVGQIDHIIALSRGGSNWPRNLQWLCASCNNKKHASDPLAFARNIGRLL